MKRWALEREGEPGAYLVRDWPLRHPLARYLPERKFRIRRACSGEWVLVPPMGHPRGVATFSSFGDVWRYCWLLSRV